MYRSFSFVSILIAIAVAAFPANTAENPFIVIDAKNGSILSQNQPHHRWHPASLTKLMTAYVTFRAISSGEIAPGSPVLISKAATRQPPSRMGYKRGVRLRVDTALKIIIIKSANDVSHALAEAVGGSVQGFVERMNDEARRLGMGNTHFTNSNGLHDKGQYSSARDMALLSVRILKEFPEFSFMFAAVGIRTSSKTHYSYNLLLERFAGATGMKTGFVCASGYNMVASAQRQGQQHLIAVVLGRSSQTDRAVAAARLITEATGKSGSGTIYGSISTGQSPQNMRPVLCTPEARASRYDPVSGTAVIKSKYLHSRKSLGPVLPVSTGGIDAPPGDAWISRNLTIKGKPPIPIKRPNYDPVLGRVILAAIGKSETGSIAVPTPNPR